MVSTPSSLSHLVGAFGLILGVFSIIIPVESAHAQEGPSLRSKDRPIRIAIDPTAQYYDTSLDQELTQLSTRLSVSVPIGQRFTVQAQGGYARTDGSDPRSGVDAEDFEQVTGLTDASGKIRYAQPVGDGSVVVSTTVNVPVGKDKLSENELNTTRFASRSFYDFRVSSYSRGLGVSPSIAWAHPVNDQLAVGIVATYQHQRGYQPREGLSSDLVPGDGIGANGGFDYKISQATSLGADFSFYRFGADEIDGEDRFELGNRISGTARYLRRSGFTKIRVLARYSNWDESKTQFGIEQGPLNRQVLPSHVMLLGGYKTRLTKTIDGRVRISGHRYFATDKSDTKTFGRLYLSPSIELGEGIQLAPHGTVAAGSYLSVGGGVRIEGSF